MSSRPFRGVFLSCGDPSGSCGAALLSVYEHLCPSVMRTGLLKAPVLPSIFSFRHFSACLSYDTTQRMEHGGRGYDLDHPHVHRLCCDRIPVLGSRGSCVLWQGRGPLPPSMVRKSLPLTAGASQKAAAVTQLPFGVDHLTSGRRREISPTPTGGSP
jgi:hypothetical protein